MPSVRDCRDYGGRRVVRYEEDEGVQESLRLEYKKRLSTEVDRRAGEEEERLRASPHHNWRFGVLARRLWPWHGPTDTPVLMSVRLYIPCLSEFMVKLSGLYTLAFVMLMDLVASATGAFLVVVFSRAPLSATPWGA